MRIIVIGLLMALSMILAPANRSVAQDTQNLQTDTILTDSISYNYRVPQIDSVAIRERISSGIQSLMKIQEENRRKQKQGAMLRIGFGIAMLAVLVVGLMRKRKR